MIPNFDEHGYLSPGIHAATLEEIAARFGRESELRQVEMESIRWLVDLAKRAGVRRIIINGSFVADVVEPNDVDCVLLVGRDYPQDAAADTELAQGLPFIQMTIVDEKGFRYYTERLYATDRNRIPKGMIEVVS